MNRNHADRSGYTLVEVLVATALTMMVLAAVVQVFGTVSESISDARSFVEKVDQLRITQRQLKQDLEGETAYMTPPLAPEQNLGYFEYVEGPLGPVLSLGDTVNTQAVNIDRGNEMDSTQGDTDDVLMFTTRSRTLPFVGRIAGVASLSQLAEVAWFVRGRTLYRRVLLIAPQTNVSGTYSTGFYNNYDLSARYDPVQGKMVPNTLADLTRPENRFAHTNGFTATNITPYVYPPHPHNAGTWLTGGTVSNPSIVWPTGAASTSTWLTGLKLPTLCESTCNAWDLSKALPTPGTTPALTLTPTSVFDAWRSPYAFSQLDPLTGNLNSASGYYNSARVSEDVILTNVIGFDVKAWDPGAPIIANSSQTNGPVVMPGDPGYTALLLDTAHCTVVGQGAYVDLNYLYPYRKAVGGVGNYQSTFSGPGDPVSGLHGSDASGLHGADASFDPDSSHVKPLCSVYETWCTRFENYNGFVDKSYDGFDDGGTSIGIVDGVNKKVIFPPYPTPLRGIQVKIRVYEPDSRQVREVTVTQSFLNE
jgi:type II secretory pathway component PulJ